MSARKLVVIGFLGQSLDAGDGSRRWERWRPTVSVCQHATLPIDRFHIIHMTSNAELLTQLTADIQQVSPQTEIQPLLVDLKDPWDFEEVYAVLHDLSRRMTFEPDREDYLVHITTGSHVQQICLFLLTESRHLPGRLLQTSPPRGRESSRPRAVRKLSAAERRRLALEKPDQPPPTTQTNIEGVPGNYRIIDLDLSQYDRLAQRFERERSVGVSFLKSGIETRNARFNRLIEEIEHVAQHSRAPMLLMGPTGAGKSKLAQRIFDLKKTRQKISGAFVELNCAVLRGDQAMSALFGHVKGSYTGATTDRPGVLKTAHQGILFLDEIGELGTDEQAMLLRALEEKRFMPVGSDKEVTSDFQLIAGTNRDLAAEVETGRFREDLLARINLWTFLLPGLKDRPEDIEPNLQYELDELTAETGRRVTFNKEARERFLKFATSGQAIWSANFRDLNAAVVRMATLAPQGRITAEIVENELERLQRSWQRKSSKPESESIPALEEVMTAEQLTKLDLFDRVQLETVVQVCRRCRSISEAGRELFAESRKEKSNPNDADRLRKYLARFDLNWSELQN